MKRIVALLLLLELAGCRSAPAHCDWNVSLGRCSASAEPQGAKVYIVAPHCAKVAFTAAGARNAKQLSEGYGFAASSDDEVSVESCQAHRDLLHAEGPAAP